MLRLAAQTCEPALRRERSGSCAIALAAVPAEDRRGETWALSVKAAPYGSLNLCMTIRSIVGEPLAVRGLDSDKAATRYKVAALIAFVGLLIADAGFCPRRFDPGAGHQPVHGSAGASGAHLPVYCA
jgi:ABC-type glutathione transport system ATPase component